MVSVFYLSYICYSTQKRKEQKMIKEDFLKAFHFRHACKLFSETKKISQKDLDFILETGRLSPSSFGLEQWRFLVIENQDIKNKLKTASFNQPQLTTDPTPKN